MLVCCKEKYFKVLKTFLKEEMFNTKLKFRPTSPINLHFSLVHQENTPCLFYDFTNPQHITKSPRGNICLGVRSKAVVLRPMGKSYREEIRFYPSASRVFLRAAVVQQWKGPSKKVVSKQPRKSFLAEMGQGSEEVKRGLHVGLLVPEQVHGHDDRNR